MVQDPRQVLFISPGSLQDEHSSAKINKDARGFLDYLSPDYDVRIIYGADSWRWPAMQLSRNGEIGDPIQSPEYNSNNKQTLGDLSKVFSRNGKDACFFPSGEGGLLTPNKLKGLSSREDLYTDYCAQRDFQENIAVVKREKLKNRVQTALGAVSGFFLGT